MKEILYVQAGSLSNFTGTHFWNTQEAYFTYEEQEEDDEGPLVNHDISFREGISVKGDPTYTPRVLIFDKKVNFGTLAATNGLYEELAGPVEDEDESWTGDVAEYRQEEVAKSQYHVEADEPRLIVDSEVRYWSDYSHTDFHPRSIHKLPDTADWESTEGNWSVGKDVFSRYNQDCDLMDNSVRFFVEECDSIQGLQLMNDAASFGSFTNSFVSDFRDDFVKLPIITFLILSEPKPVEIDVDNLVSIRKAVNDALCLQSLNELSTLIIPIIPPQLWTSNPFDSNSVFQNSALLSATIESVTLPIRLKRSPEDFPSVCAQLNWRGDTRFAHLSGSVPGTKDAVVDFSAVVEDTKGILYARRDVTRGFSTSEVAKYEECIDTSSVRRQFLSSTHSFAYPVPYSFPSRVLEQSTIRPFEQRGIFSRSRSVSGISSLTTTSLTSTLFFNYATFLDRCLKRRADTGTGAETDDLKDLVNELWTLHDTYSSGDQDEEYFVDGGMAEDD